MLAEGSAGPAGTALLGAWPPAEQGPVLCFALPGRQKNSLTSSLKSPQVSCGSQQILRRKIVCLSLRPLLLIAVVREVPLSI